MYGHLFRLRKMLCRNFFEFDKNNPKILLNFLTLGWLLIRGRRHRTVNFSVILQHIPIRWHKNFRGCS